MTHGFVPVPDPPNCVTDQVLVVAWPEGSPLPDPLAALAARLPEAWPLGWARRWEATFGGVTGAWESSGAMLWLPLDGYAWLLTTETESERARTGLALTHVQARIATSPRAAVLGHLDPWFR